MLEIHQTKDFEELSAAQGEWEIQHRPVNAGPFRGRLLLSRIGGIRVDLERWNGPLELIGMSPQNGLSFALPLRDGASYLSGGHEVTANRIDVFPPGCEVFAQIRPKSALISCTLPEETLELLEEAPFELPLAMQQTGHSVLPLRPGAVADLRRWWLKLVELSGRSEIEPHIGNRLLNETIMITARALTVTDESYDRRPRRNCLLARRARDFMLERQENPPSIREVCAFLMASERTLHNAFREVYDVSPKRFLKAQRLFAVRRVLKSSGPAARVRDIAFSFGFWDLGRFAREYRRMFGELPSSTLTDA